MSEKAKELIAEFTKEILKIGWNDAIEAAANICADTISRDRVRSLKK